MILLTIKLQLNLVTFAPLCPPIQGNTPSQFFRCNLQLTHTDTLFLEIYLSYGTKFHLIYYQWQIEMLFVELLNVIFWCYVTSFWCMHVSICSFLYFCRMFCVFFCFFCALFCSLGNICECNCMYVFWEAPLCRPSLLVPPFPLLEE